MVLYASVLFILSIAVQIQLYPGETTIITLKNNCNYTVWPITHTNSPSVSSTNVSRAFLVVHSGESKIINVPSGWVGRIWGRTFCSTDKVTGNFSCLTGDCGTGKLDCQQHSYKSPVSLIEFATYQVGNIDFYDVSLVDGYNLPLTVSPNSSQGSRSCDVTGCVFNFNDGCPDEFRVTNGSQGIIGCRSACDVFHTQESCCTNLSDCQRHSFSLATLIFKKSCPRAYSYALDDETSSFTCPSGTTYTVTFCPSASLSRVVSEPAFQSIQPSTSPSPVLSPLAQPSSSTPKATPFSNNFSHPPSTSRHSKRKHTVIIAVVLSTTALASILVLYGVWAYMSKNKALKTNTYLEAYEIKEAVMDSLLFDLSTLRTATANFSVDNKLGEGGFGAVYKGKLENGQEIAVKRLSRNSAQGVAEFKTEVILVAKLRHKNLVKLLGYCVAIEEKILVYEFLPNSSLDRLLWDEKHKVSLDWSTRFNIIIGIARGLLYLHEDSPLKVIHRDLKPSNILLDQNMNPKISDFGLAKLFGGDETQDDTKRIVGTYGYMAPEYATTGHYSVKSDVYSFGVIVLEILSGQRTRHFGRVQVEEALLHRAWRLWNEEKALDLVDATLCNNFSSDEMIKCIHIGLLCIQEDASVRPRMTSIVGFLNGKASSLPMPKPPNFFGTNTNFEESRLQYNYPGSYSGTETITDLYSRD
ncbi:cysteine-rich receptor-like protein kinase 6 isoform X2 [Amaranthus tricolor]|uniref:cysteine-rich receptor-like protein kinase 6 isoform X2 n=1 Tax=Amaranthus tricolor TaxID=29722 RepID=UPI00258B766C|nr:cysteine-rich receptor-like protein kinase 6 isoform X2 [Amaranthus tricolor]